MLSHHLMGCVVGEAYLSTRMLSEFEFMPHCHALQHPDVDDAGNMQNTSGCFGNLGLRFKIY
jgi:hypothetical protein